jgi:hypothetical protein
MVESIMARAARFSGVVSTSAAATDRPVLDRAASNVFVTVVIFSLGGLLLSLLALMMGRPQFFD